MDAVKLVDAKKGLIEGWAIPFGGPMPGGKDLDNEAFSKDTELYLDAYPSRPILYHHGKDSLLGFNIIGSEVKATRKEQGIWLEAQLNLAGKYKDLLLELLGKDLLGFSSAAHIGSIVKTADGLITSWLWNETSLTPTPANPFSVVSMKSLGVTEPVDITYHLQLCEKLGRLPDADDVATWMAGKTQVKSATQNIEKVIIDHAVETDLLMRIEVLEADYRQREQAEMDKIRRANKRLKEALHVTS